MQRNTEPFRTFSFHYRSRYGVPVGKIPLDMGIPCPNRGQGGCIFCRPSGFTPGYLKSGDAIPRQISLGKKGLLAGRFTRYLAYFQQENCTTAPPALLLATIANLLTDDACLGIILSCRPDSVRDEFLTPLAELITRSGRECLFELGLQSAHDSSLAFLNRNHTVQDFIDAHQAIRRYAIFQVGAHLLFGIPGEGIEEMRATVRFITDLSIDSLKLHHLQVLRDTPLHQMYLDGVVRPLNLEEYTQILLDLLPLVPPEVVIHRLWASSHPEMLVAPKWNILTGHLSRQLRKRMAAIGCFQGQSLRDGGSGGSSAAV